jgi:hypothetical protein
VLDFLPDAISDNPATYSLQMTLQDKLGTGMRAPRR